MKIEYEIDVNILDYLQEIFLETEGYKILLAYIARESEYTYKKEVYDKYLKLYMDKFKEQELIKNKIIESLNLNINNYKINFDFNNHKAILEDKEIINDG